MNVARALGPAVLQRAFRAWKLNLIAIEDLRVARMTRSARETVERPGRNVSPEDCHPHPFDIMAIYSLYQTDG